MERGGFAAASNMYGSITEPGIVAADLDSDKGVCLFSKRIRFSHGWEEDHTSDCVGGNGD